MCLTPHADAPRIRRMIGIGMIFLVLSFVAETLKHTFRISPAPLEFTRGFCIGICLVIEARALWLVRRLRREG